MVDGEYRADVRLKHALSVRLLVHLAEEQGMSVAEYGAVYDSERHERLLNDLVAIVRGAAKVER